MTIDDSHILRLRVLAIPVLASFVLPGLTQAAPGLISDHDNYLPREPIVVAFTEGPGNKKDWVGVYPEGVVPGTQGSTIWNYVDGTQNGNTGLKQGNIRFGQGLALAGVWDAYFLLNDGYTNLAKISFNVVDPSTPLARVSKRVYAPAETISVTFTNGPANAKDWIAIYKEGQVPGAAGIVSTIWAYVDGSKTGTLKVSDGTLVFTNGIATPGNYFATLLENDGYTILARENFSIVTPPAAAPELISIAPGAGETNVSPAAPFSAVVQTGARTVDPATVQLFLDESIVAHQFSATNNRANIAFQRATVLPPLSTHTYRLVFADSTGARFTNAVNFTVVAYQDIRLPAPLYLETFDGLSEGQLPSGWTEQSFTDALVDTVDFEDLNSAAYKSWTVVNVERFRGRFVTYSNPDGNAGEQSDYQRVLAPSITSVQDGKLVDPLASGRMLFGNSGYRNGRSQVLHVTTRDIDLTGRTNIHVSFKSLYEQNQDSFGALEYSVNQGTTWLPVYYLLDRRDILTNETGAIDIDLTLSTEYGDVARYTDEAGVEQGGTYGAFVGAAVTPALIPHLRGGLDDNPVDGKRVELHKLPMADNQAKVRLRFTYAGTDSWYWGVDDFGLYSISATVADPVRLFTAGRLDGDYKVDESAILNPGEKSVSVAVPTGTAFYRLGSASKIIRTRVQDGRVILNYE